MTYQRKKELLAQSKANTDQGNLESIFAELKASDPDFPEDGTFQQFQAETLHSVEAEKEQAEQGLLKRIERHAAEGRKFWREVYVTTLGKTGDIDQALIIANHALEDFDSKFPIES